MTNSVHTAIAFSAQRRASAGSRRIRWTTLRAHLRLGQAEGMRVALGQGDRLLVTAGSLWSGLPRMQSICAQNDLQQTPGSCPV